MILAPLLLRDQRTANEDALAVTSVALLLVTLALLGLLLLIFLAVLEVRVELVDPLLIDFEQHERIRVSLVIVYALQFTDVDWVGVPLHSENAPGL